MKKLIIEINEFNYNCADGCCTNYGTSIKINGEQLLCENQDLSTQIEQILKHLGFDIEIINKYNGELI